MIKISFINDYSNKYKEHFKVDIKDRDEMIGKIKLKSLKDNFEEIMESLIYRNIFDKNTYEYSSFVEEYIKLCYFCSKKKDMIKNIDLIKDIGFVKEYIDLNRKNNMSINNPKFIDKVYDYVKKSMKYINGDKKKGIFGGKVEIKYDVTGALRKFRYESIDTEIKREILCNIDSETCPYCNHSYIVQVPGYSIHELDHLYPKSIFPLFCISLYNLVPSCKVCNQSFKSDNFELDSFINPYLDSYGEEGTFFLDGISTDEIKVEFDCSKAMTSEKKRKLEGDVELFQLKKLYGSHQQYIKAIVQQKRNYSDNVIKNLKKFLKDNNMNNSDEDINKLLYGFELKEEEDKIYTMSKFTRDIINNYKDEE